MGIGRNIKKRTLYDQIRQEIRTSITNGELKPGDKLPTEEQLTFKYKASRPTINKAIRSLSRDGLVESRKRGGTVVLGQTQIWVSVTDISEYVQKRNQEHTFKLIKCEYVPDGNQLWQDLEVDESILNIECVHYSGSLPVQHEQRFINLKALPAARNINFVTISPGIWLQKHAPWPLLTQTIGAIGAGEVLAKLLNIRHGTPCLGIHQVARSEEEYLSMAALTSPSGRFSISSAERI